MQKITPHLWFDKEALEAANLYISTFPNSRVKHTAKLQNTPSGSVDIVTFELSGLEIQAINAGLYSSSTHPYRSTSPAKRQRKLTK